MDKGKNKSVKKVSENNKSVKKVIENASENVKKVIENASENVNASEKMKKLIETINTSICDIVTTLLFNEQNNSTDKEKKEEIENSKNEALENARLELIKQGTTKEAVQSYMKEIEKIDKEAKIELEAIKTWGSVENVYSLHNDFFKKNNVSKDDTEHLVCTSFFSALINASHTIEALQQKIESMETYMNKEKYNAIYSRELMIKYGYNQAIATYLATKNKKNWEQIPDKLPLIYKNVKDVIK